MKRVLIEKEVLDEMRENGLYGVQCEHCGRIIFMDLEWENEFIIMRDETEDTFLCQECSEGAKEHERENKYYTACLTYGGIGIYLDGYRKYEQKGA